MLFFTAIISVVFTALNITAATALPTTSSSSSSRLSARDVQIQTWKIPRMQMHMMSPSTGIPGNPPWPESRRFNSTIDFDVLMSGEKVKCQGSWENGTLPNEKMGCEPIFSKNGSDAVYFAMRNYDNGGKERRPELSFLLSLYQVKDNYTTHGITAITANTPSEPTSYLTCLLGRPYDGLRCEIGSYLSVDRDLVVEGIEVIDKIWDW